MMQRDVYSNVHRTEMISVLREITRLRNSARIIGVAAAIAIDCSSPGNASHSNAKPHAVGVTPHTLDVADDTEKRAFVGNGKPVARTDMIDHQNSSDAINVLANDLVPDGDGLTLIFASA